MQKYKILIVGHSKYPEGIKTFLEFFLIPSEDITTHYIDNENSQEIFKKQLIDFYKSNLYVITFADLAGGSPHKTAFEAISEAGTENHHLIAGVPPGVILETSMAGVVIGINGNPIEKVIKPSIEICNRNIVYSSHDKIISYTKVAKEKDKEEGI